MALLYNGILCHRRKKKAALNVLIWESCRVYTEQQVQYATICVRKKKQCITPYAGKGIDLCEDTQEL